MGLSGDLLRPTFLRPLLTVPPRFPVIGLPPPPPFFFLLPGLSSCLSGPDARGPRHSQNGLFRKKIRASCPPGRPPQIPRVFNLFPRAFYPLRCFFAHDASNHRCPPGTGHPSAHFFFRTLHMCSDPRAGPPMTVFLSIPFFHKNKSFFFFSCPNKFTVPIVSLLSGYP